MVGLPVIPHAFKYHPEWEGCIITAPYKHFPDGQQGREITSRGVVMSGAFDYSLCLRERKQQLLLAVTRHLAE